MRKAMVLVLIVAVIAVLTVAGCSKKKSIPLDASEVSTSTPAGTSTYTNTATATATDTFGGGSTWTATHTSTGTATNTRTPTATVTNTPPPKPAGWIDDCEDIYGPNQNDFQVTGGPILNSGGYWITYDDNSSKNNGTSYVWPMSEIWAGRKGITFEPFVMSAPGYDGSSYGTAFASRITGYVTTNTTYPPEETGGFQYGFIGMGTQVTPTAGQDHGCYTADISGYTGLRFWTKGDGVSNGWRMKLPYVTSSNCDGNVTYTANSYTNDDEWGKDFTAPADWTQIDIPFATLTQYGWGATGGKGCNATQGTNYAGADGVVLTGPPCPIAPTASSLILQNARQIQFQSNGQAIKWPATRELWIDDIELY